MKSEKGITITSLVIYVIVATMIIGAMAMISSTFFSNMKLVQNQDEYAPEFNKFSMFFIQDCKNNVVAEELEEGTQVKIGNDIIYRFDKNQNVIYRNDTVIAEKVQAIDGKIFTVSTKEVENTNTTKYIVTVHLKIGVDEKNMEKTIDYVLKYW